MSCANAAMLSVIDQIPPSRRVLFAMLRSVARISTPFVLPIPLGVFPQRNFPHPVPVVLVCPTLADGFEYGIVTIRKFGT